MGLVGGSPRPKKAETEKISALPVELDSRDARFVTELVSGNALRPVAVKCMHPYCNSQAERLSTVLMCGVTLRTLYAIVACEGDGHASTFRYTCARQAPVSPHTPRQLYLCEASTLVKHDKCKEHEVFMSTCLP